MQTRRLLAVLFVVLALIAAACGGRSDDDEAGGDDTSTSGEDTADDDTGNEDPTGDDAAADDDDSTGDDDAGDDDTGDGDTTEPDPCEGVTLEATDIGVTPETITVLAMADVGSDLAPGLFQGSLDGMAAWADHVNDEGGLACREVVVQEFDSALNATETTNGFLAACNDALALVGTTVLFGTDTADLNSCGDQDGNPIGVPDLSYITTEAPHQCSPNSFHVSRPGGSCPYDEGVRDFAAQVGAVRYVIEAEGRDSYEGIYLVPADLPSTRASGPPQIAAHEEVGIVYSDAVGVFGASTQADFSPIVQALSEGGLNWIYNGSNDQAMIKLRSEAEVQGLDPDSVVWMCSLSCYTPDFIEQGGDVVEGTYVWMSFVPFAETDASPELADFIEAIGDPFPQAWAAGAWADGVMLETVVADIMATDGPNGLTRQALLDRLGALADFDANGWWSPADMTRTDTIAECVAVLQVQDGEYVRLFPEEPGELACGSDNVVRVSVDPFDIEL